jgi:starch synthase
LIAAHRADTVAARTGETAVKTLFLTNEYPPHIYGGAGVHVDYLSRELAKLIDVEVRCFGDQRTTLDHLRVRGYGVDARLFAATDAKLQPALQALARGIGFAAEPVDADVVHCHTWYSYLGGVVLKLAYGLPLVITTHSLEPLRSWKREQLGSGYQISSWIERTALEMADVIIAVSNGMKEDILRLFHVDPARLRVVYNGIDTEEYHPVKTRAALDRYGIHATIPYVLFVGRIARQKGILHLVHAIEHLPADVQVVLCAAAPDTREISEEMAAAVRHVQGRRPHVVWICEMVDKCSAIELYSHAAVFCCPSIYEPFGIINLEAMACGTPVVASAVGGIPEVVVPEETGLLVDVGPQRGDTSEPEDAQGYARRLAAALNRLLANEGLRRRMGMAGRQRAVRHFGWAAIAHQVVGVYEAALRQHESEERAT